MKPSLLSRSWLVAWVPILLLTLVACERPLQDEEANPTTAPPALATPPLQLEIPTPPVVAPTADPSQPAVQETPVSQEPTPVTEQPPGEAPSTSQNVTYLVQSGDTLFKIAQQYNVSVEDLAAANNISNVNVLEVGQLLIIPVGGLPDTADSPAAEEPSLERTHTVRPGETLFRIAQLYGLTFEELAAYNNIENPERIDVGQVLRIPPAGN